MSGRPRLIPPEGILSIWSCLSALSTLPRSSRHSSICVERYGRSAHICLPGWHIDFFFLSPGTCFNTSGECSRGVREWAFCQGGEVRVPCTVGPFLGFHSVAGGVRMDPDRVSCGKLASPLFQQGPAEVLGFANFTGVFIRNFSQLAASSDCLTSTKMTFRWSNAAEAAFTKLRGRFVSAPILRAPDPTVQFVVEVDASEVGGRRSAIQRATSDDKVHPCAFFFPSTVFLPNAITTSVTESCWPSS